MEGQEIINHIKNTYKFKEGYSLVIGFNEEKEYWGAAYQTKKIISSKNKEESITDIMLSMTHTKDKKEYREFIETYCELK